MTSASIVWRRPSPIFIFLASLVCSQVACSFSSLDYLKNGGRREGGIGADALVPDVEGLDVSILDTSKLNDTGIGGTGGTADTNAGGAGGRIFDGPAGEVNTGLGGAGGTALDAAGDLPIGGTGGSDRDGAMDARTGGTGTGGKSTGGTGTGGASAGGTGGTQPKDAAPKLDSLIPDSPVLDGLTTKPSVLMVVGAIPLKTADEAIQSQLIKNGYEVTTVKDLDLASITTENKVLILISSTVGSGNVNTKFRTTPVPVMVWEPMIYDKMGFVDGTVSETEGVSTTDFTSIVVNSAAGELAAGLSGTIVVQTANTLNYGVPNAQAVSVASIPGQPNQLSIFAYDTGVQMYGIAAPARRVGFFLSMTGAANLTADGWRLFDAALAWLTK